MTTKRKDSKGRVLRNGEVQRSDGKYMFRYTDSDGERKTVYSWKLVETDKIPEGKKQSPSLRELEKQIQKDLEDGIHSDSARTTTINDLFKSFLDIRIDLSDSTRVNYTWLYNKNIRDSIGSRKIQSIKTSDIQKLYVSLLQDRGLKPGTVQRVHILLSQILDIAVSDSIIRTNPASPAIKGVKRMFDMRQDKRRALTEEQQKRFIEFVYSSTTYKKWGPLFTVLLGTGMRIGEAVGLQWYDCNFVNGSICVNRSLLYSECSYEPIKSYRIVQPKTKSGIRTIPMLDDVRTALLAEKKKGRVVLHGIPGLEGYNDFVFVNAKRKPVNPGTVYRALQTLTKAYNKMETKSAIDEGRAPCLLPKISAHILRHTFCTRLCENESNLKVIQDVMGHANIHTTMDVYADATETKKAASFKNLEGKMKLA